MSAPERARGRWLLLAAALWLSAGLVLPVAGTRIVLRLRGPVNSEAGRAVLPSFLRLLGAGSLGVGTLLLSAGLLRRRSGDPGPEVDLASARGVSRAGALVAAAAVLGAGTILVVASGRSFEYDEILEMGREVKEPLGAALRPRAFINHLSGTLLARGSVALFGPSERGARAGSVALAILGLAATAVVASRFEPGFLAVALPPLALGMHGFILEYSTQIRGYSAFTWAGFGTVALVALALAREGRPRRRVVWSAGGLALVLGLSHFFGLLYLGFVTVGLHLYLWTGWRGLGPPVADLRRRRAELAGMAGALAAAVAVSYCFWGQDLPWLLYRSRVVALPSATARPASGMSLRKLMAELPGLWTGTGLGLGVAVLALVAGSVLVLAWRHAPALRVVILTSFVPPALVLAAGAIRPVYIFARFFAASVPLAVLALAVGAALLVRRFPRPALPASLVLVVVVVALLPGTWTFLDEDFGYREGVAVGVRWLDRVGDARSRFIPVGWGEESDVVRYYLPAARTLLLAGDADVVNRRRAAGIRDLLVALGRSQVHRWEKPGPEPITRRVPVERSGSRQIPIVLLATRPAALP